MWTRRASPGISSTFRGVRKRIALLTNNLSGRRRAVQVELRKFETITTGTRERVRAKLSTARTRHALRLILAGALAGGARFAIEIEHVFRVSRFDVARWTSAFCESYRILNGILATHHACVERRVVVVFVDAG